MKRTRRHDRTGPPSKRMRAAVARRPRWPRVLRWLCFLALLGSFLGAAAIASLFYYYSRDPQLPSVASLRRYEPQAVTRLYDRHGLLIGELSTQRRSVVAYSKIPKLLVQAIVAAEDADFFRHGGLDYMGALRAFFANLRAGRFAQGGSTITQQVVKTFLLSPERTIRRKMQEIILARRLEAELTKEQILHLYLNQIYLGHGRYGVQEASRFYFGRDVDKLGLAEVALLAGLPQSPERLSPFKHPQRAKRRQRYVLKEMFKGGYITESAYKQAVDRPIRVASNSRPYYNVAPEIADVVQSHLAKAFGAESLSRLGLRVQTTIDAKYQVAARQALQWGLRAIDARHGYRSRLSHQPPSKRAAMVKRLARTQGKLVDGGYYRGLVVAVNDGDDSVTVNLGSTRAEVAVDDPRYNPEKHVASKRFAIGDLIAVRVRGGKYVFDPGPQGAMIVIEPKSGDVLAIVGGYEYQRGGFDRALRARRQPGSSFKPFVYAAALQSKRYTPATIVEDAHFVVEGWSPKNFDNDYLGPLRLRVALARSRNTVAGRLIKAVGIEPVKQIAQSLGISSPLSDDLSLSLGSSSVSVLEMAAAYAAIANGGSYHAPNFIARIGDDEVKRPPAHEALPPALAFVLTSMMQSVVREGTAQRARGLGRAIAGKTGTTNDQKDAWFVGFTPQICAAVWVGFDRPRTLGRKETGAHAALPIWVRFMREVLKGTAKLAFPQPAGVVVERIDPDTGLLARPDQPNAIEEVFIDGTQPKQQALRPNDVDPNTILMGPGVP
ncbi:MAG: PBP1A family penicillin-binding protein [Deltaproteobacteria bacterium]|nr:PBP1A family penicillin-binding protein [Deltaproteobacteria bacterium]